MTFNYRMYIYLSFNYRLSCIFIYHLIIICRLFTLIQFGIKRARAPVLDQFSNCIFSLSNCSMKEMLFLLFREEYDTWD